MTQIIDNIKRYFDGSTGSSHIQAKSYLTPEERQQVAILAALGADKGFEVTVDKSRVQIMYHCDSKDSYLRIFPMGSHRIECFFSSSKYYHHNGTSIGIRVASSIEELIQFVIQFDPNNFKEYPKP
jgi:hypothetical protein